MNKQWILLLFALLLFACSKQEHASQEVQTTVSGADSQPTPDTIYTNGKIYTVNEKQPWAEAVAIQNGKFLAVGSIADIEKHKGDNTTVIDLGGKFVMPGIGDAHIHPALLMPKRAFCALPGTFHEPTEQMTMDALKECIANYPKDRKWFIAHGFSTPAMSKKTLSREVLDKLIPDRPAYIEDESGHNVWFNTKAMQAAGVTKDFKDTPEEFFSRTADGNLEGVAFEGAMNPFIAVLPPFDTKLKKIAYKKMLDEATSLGITMFGDAYVNTLPDDHLAYAALHKEGVINLHTMLYLKGNLGTAELTPVAELEKWWSVGLPGKKGVKLGMGGAIESVSEMLIDGYKENLDTKPIEALTPGADEDAPTGKNAQAVIPAEQFANYMAELDAAGYQVIVHAIGDGTVRATLDGFESVIKKNGNNRLRHRLDHCSVIHPDDFKRFVELDVACTIWPQLNAPIDYNLSNVFPQLKPSTKERIYDNRSRWDAGIRLFNHSDAPAATFWPWWGMEATVTTGFPGKPEKGLLNAKHALTVKEAIIAYTINSAWALRYDDIAGSIETGKSADMIVLNHNLLEIPKTDIHKTKVQKTIFKGKVVYKK